MPALATSLAKRGVVFDEEGEVEGTGDIAFSAVGFGGEDVVDGDVVLDEPGGGGGEPFLGAASDDGEGRRGGTRRGGVSQQALERELGVEVGFVRLRTWRGSWSSLRFQGWER